jgi:hypothetical protein
MTVRLSLAAKLAAFEDLHALTGRPVAAIHPREKRTLGTWAKTTTADAAGWEAICRRHPLCRVGVLTGGGLVVIDVDRPGGDAKLGRLTRAVRTPRGHGQYYFAGPAGERLRGSVGKIAANVDVRADGNLVVAPPSPGYEFTNDLPIAPLPDVLLDAIRAPSNRSGTFGPGFEPRAHVPAGERHGYLLSAAGWLAGSGMVETHEDLVAELLDHASQVCAPPDSERSRRQHVESIARWVWRQDRGERP